MALLLRPVQLYAVYAAVSSIAGRAVAVDYMKARYEGGKQKEPPGANVPKTFREPRKLNFEWDK